MSPEGARAANGSSPHQRSSPGALRGGTSALGGTSTRNFRLLSAAIVAVLLWETAERTLRAGPWRHQLLRRVVLPDRWALAGLDNGSKALAANITTGIIAAAQQLQQIQQQQEAEEAVRKREEEFAARQQRVNECRGWQGANTGLDGADEGWRWLAGLRAGVLDAASGAASDARDKGGNALKQAVASRLAQLIKNRSVTRAAVCDAALIAPKGALLFLTRGKLPLRGLWQRWLEDAAGRLPRRHAAAFGCSPAHVELLRQACTAGNETSLYARQHLFSIHIHSPPSFAQDYEEGSIFKGRTLACRINPAWGSHDLVEAQRLLYRDALLDPLVQRLMMVSESCAPLYPAPVVWAQAVREGKSRVDACRPGANVAKRGGADLWGSVLRPELWRKSSQWSMLLILRDEELNALFARHCYVGWRPLGGGYRTCTSDEHYLPTTLAYYNRSAECHCTSQNSSQDGVSYVEWTTTSAVDGHPASFGGGDVNPDLLRRMRHKGPCPEGSISEAVGSIDSAFVDAADWTQETCEAVRAKEKLPIEPVKLAEGGWRCVGGTHWSPKKDGRCCTADEKECNVGAVLVAPSPQERRPDFGIAGFKPLPGGQCALLGRKFREDAVEALLGLASECGKDEVPVFGTWGCPVAGKKKDGKGGGADGSESSKAQQGGDGEGQGGQNGGGGGSASSSEERKDGNEEQKGGEGSDGGQQGQEGSDAGSKEGQQSGKRGDASSKEEQKVGAGSQEGQKSEGGDASSREEQKGGAGSGAGSKGEHKSDDGGDAASKEAPTGSTMEQTDGSGTASKEEQKGSGVGGGASSSNDGKGGSAAGKEGQGGSEGGDTLSKAPS